MQLNSEDTVEMETGVGKTYTYIKTMFELHKAYGWSKFIVIVPSIAIREGVYNPNVFQICTLKESDCLPHKVRLHYNKSQNRIDLKLEIKSSSKHKCLQIVDFLSWGISNVFIYLANLRL